jgi:PAS domain S-box-containing protein
MKTSTQTNFKYRLIGLVVIVSGILTFTGFYYFRQEKKSTQNSTYNQLQSVSRLKSNQLYQWHKERFSEALFFSSNLPYTTYAKEITQGNNNAAKYLRSSLERIMTNGRYENIFMIDREGRLVFSTIPEYVLNDSMVLDNVKKALHTNKLVVRDFYYCDIHKKVHFEITAPVSVDGNIIAALVFKVDPNDYLYPLIMEWPSQSRSAETYITRLDGERVSYLTGLRFVDNSDLKLSFSLSDTAVNAVRAASGYEGVLEGENYRGDKVLSDVRKVPGSSWFIVSEIALDEVYEDLNKMALFITLIILFIILFVAAAMAWVYQLRQRGTYKELLIKSIQLYQFNKEFEATLYSIADGVITTDKECKVLRMNPVAEKMTGWKEKNAAGKDMQLIFSLIDQESGEKIDNCSGQVLFEGGKKAHKVSALLVSNEGVQTSVAINAAPIRDNNDEMMGVVVVFRDQTEEHMRQRLIQTRLSIIKFALDHTLKETLSWILGEVGKLTKSPQGFLFFLTSDEKEIWMQCWSNSDGGKACRSENEGRQLSADYKRVLDKCVRKREPFINDGADVASSKREMVVPVIRNNKVVAVLGIEGKPSRYDDNDLVTVTYLADITWEVSESKRKEENLRQSEERFMHLFERAPLGYQSLDEDGRFIEVNQAWLDTFGYEKEEIIGKKFSDFLLPESLEKFESGFLKLKEEGKISSEFMITHKSGETKHISFTGRIGYKRDGSFEKTHCILQDITKRRRVEEMLRESEQKYRTLVNQMQLGLAMHRIILDSSGKPVDYIFLDVNNSFERLTGLKREEIIGKRVLEILPKTEKIWIERYGHTTLTGEPVSFENYAQELGRYYSVLAYRYRPMEFAVIVEDITDRKIMEKAILESEEKYRRITENMSDGIWTADLDFNITYFSPSIQRIIGSPLFQEEIEKRVSPEVIDNIKAMVFEELAKDTGDNRKMQKTVEIDYKRDDGKILWIGMDISFIRDSDGKVTGFQGVVRNITDLKKAEGKILESMQNYKTLIDGMNETVWVHDLDGNIIDVNKSAEIILGYTKEEFQSMGLKGIDSSLEEVTIKDMVNSMPEDRLHIFETSHKAKDGKIIPVEIYSSNVYYMGQRAILSIARDITQRKRDEDIHQIMYEIARSAIYTQSLEDLLTIVHQELDKVLDAANFHVALYRPETGKLHKVFFVNEQYEVDEWSVENSLSGHVYTSGQTVLINSNEEPEENLDVRYKSTAKLAKSWLGVPLMEGSEVIGVMVIQSYNEDDAYDRSTARLMETIAHEISLVLQRHKMVDDLIRAKEKAEESDRLKTAFLANISHEIRTPMNGIIGFLELMKSSDLSEEEREKYFEVVDRSGQRLLDTINDIVEISKIESGQTDINNTEFNLTDIMEYYQDFFKQKADQKGVEIKIARQITGIDAFIITDKYKLEGVLVNLLNNSVKFTLKGGIEFGNYIQEGKLVFFVKDTGIGIPENKLDMIFERFVQADLSTSRPYEGSGLGLAIVKAYIQALGGKIWIESEVDKGSVFYFSIPYVPVHSQDVKEEEKETVLQKKEKRGLTVVVAEDDEASFLYMKAILKGTASRIIHCSNGAETVRTVRETPGVSIILMDIRMPGMSGIEATIQIRSFDKEVPIIAQTAYAFEEDKQWAMEAGCNDYITKPISSRELLELIEKYTSSEG